MVCGALIWSYDAIVGIDWPEFLKAGSSVVTAVVAGLALWSWKRQDRAKRNAEFIDDLLDTSHAYIDEILVALGVFRVAKIGLGSYAPTWEQGDRAEIARQGAIKFIEKYGADNSAKLRAALDGLAPTSFRLRSLAAKGQIFKFDGYEQCQRALDSLVTVSNQMSGFAGILASAGVQWDHPEAAKALDSIIAIAPDEMERCITQANIQIIEFSQRTYGRVYG